MTKEKFIEKWKAWFSYVLREDLALELQADLEKIENELSKDNWIKIESEGDLPTDKNTQYSVSKDKKVFQSTVNCGTVKHWFNINKITHYQKFVKPSAPTI